MEKQQMSTNITGSRSKIRERVQKQPQRKRIFQIATLVMGLLLIVAAGYLIISKISTSRPKYEPGDVVYDKPLKAIHEMAGASLSSIKFLPKDGPQPKVAVSETFYDFESIGSNEVVHHEFVISNIGEAPLTISRAYTTCGCTTANFTSTEIPPGKSILMTLTLDAGFHNVRGQTVQRGVIIENNDPHNSQLEIWAQASVKNGP
jgi:hypothetical protein